MLAFDDGVGLTGSKVVDEAWVVGACTVSGRG